MKIFSRGQWTDLDPMDSEANAGAELDRLFPTESGAGSSYSELGFWKPEMMRTALAAQMQQEEGRRRARTAENVAATNANASSFAARMNALIHALSQNEQRGVEREKISSAERIAEALRQSGREKDLLHERGETGRTQMKGETDLEKARIGADLQSRLMSKLGTNSESYTTFYSKAQEALKAQGNKKPSPEQINDLAGRMRRGFYGADAGGGDVQSRPKSTAPTTNAMSVYAPETISDTLLQDTPALSLSGQMGSEPPKNWNFSNRGWDQDPRSVLDMSTVETGAPSERTQGANPMSRYVSPETQALLKRIAAEEQANPPVGYRQIKGTPGFTGKRQDQFIPIRAQQPVERGLDMAPFDAYAQNDFDAPNMDRFRETIQAPKTSWLQEQEDVLRAPETRRPPNPVMRDIVLPLLRRLSGRRVENPGLLTNFLFDPTGPQ